MGIKGSVMSQDRIWSATLARTSPSYFMKSACNQESGSGNGDRSD